MQASLLRNHQQSPVRELLAIFSRSNSAVDLSDCGTGKTYVACAVVQRLRTATLVVCPKIACSQWHAAAEHFGDTISAVGYELLRTGGTPYGVWEHPPTDQDLSFYKCDCCQLTVDIADIKPCYVHHLGIHCVSRKRAKWNYGKFTFHPSVKTVIFDEIQRCGGTNSLNADMLIAAKRQGLRILGLTATLASTPLQMKAIGCALGLFNLSQFAQWARRFGVRYDASFHGLHWFAGADKQTEIMATIRDEIIPGRGVRVTTASIPDFPEVDISAELYDLDEADKINSIYAEMEDALRVLDERGEQFTETPLTVMLRAQQRVELLKVPIAVELAKDYIAHGFSIGIFCNFRQTIDELRVRLDCDCVIDGSADGVRNRQRNTSAFQSNISKLILVNSAAGGVALDLHDLHGGHPRGGLVFPGYNATALRQVFGRFPRDGGKSRSFYKVMLAAGTGDVKIHRALRAKMNNLDALNDADLLPNNLTISGDDR